jgi:hypothetical protein
MPPRRVWPLLIIGGLVTVALFLTPSVRGSVPVPGAPLPARFTGKIPQFKVPDFRFSFRTASHKPPEQKNSTSGDSSWYSDWKWLNPFSSSITLDENRSVLPPLRVRPPVYTYYESKSATDEETRKIDQELLLTWRRAWWAHGFYPVILSQAEALNNPISHHLQGKGLPAALEFEFLRWLAWSHMGGGLLSSWHCVPMSSYDDELLSSLRRGQYPGLTRFEGLGAGLFAGEKSQIDNAIKDALLNLKINTFKSIIEAIPADRFKVEQPTSLAYYDSATIKSKYPSLAQKLAADPAKGRSALTDLIVTHLHTIWQNTFSGGCAEAPPSTYVCGHCSFTRPREYVRPMPRVNDRVLMPSKQTEMLSLRCFKNANYHATHFPKHFQHIHHWNSSPPVHPHHLAESIRLHLGQPYTSQHGARPLAHDRHERHPRLWSRRPKSTYWAQRRSCFGLRSWPLPLAYCRAIAGVTQQTALSSHTLQRKSRSCAHLAARRMARES